MRPECRDYRGNGGSYGVRGHRLQNWLRSEVMKLVMRSRVIEMVLRSYIRMWLWGQRSGKCL